MLFIPQHTDTFSKNYKTVARTEMTVGQNNVGSSSELADLLNDATKLLASFSCLYVIAARWEGRDDDTMSRWTHSQMYCTLDAQKHWCCMFLIWWETVGFRFGPWPLLNMNEQAVVRLGNALPTEAAAAAVDSSPILQMERNETGTDWGRNIRCRNIRYKQY